MKTKINLTLEDSVHIVDTMYSIIFVNIEGTVINSHKEIIDRKDVN